MFVVLALVAATLQVGQSLLLERTGSGRFDHLRSSTVRIQAASSKFDWMQPFMPGEDNVGLGSGFIVQTEPYPLIVTNEHVVNDAKQVMLQLLLYGEQQWEAQVVSVCSKFDVALLVLRQPDKFSAALDERNITLRALKLARGIQPMGADVVALGFPLGQDALKISKGNIAGNEEVDGNICIQSTAPISPGSSGGPLLNAEGTEVVGVNFAKATEGENINYVIPAWRVSQLVRKHFRDQSAPQKDDKWRRLRVEVPKPYVAAIEANEALYARSGGCKHGVYIARIGDRSFFKNARPPVQADSFLVSVNGRDLDEFGMGQNMDYAADRVRFSDLFFMVEDISDDATFEMCTNGETTKHEVSLSWSPAYGQGVRYVDEPTLEGLSDSYELFGDISVMAMTVNHVRAIIAKTNDPSPARWLHPDFIAHPRLVVNHVRSGSYAADVIAAGSAVAKVNGREVRTLADFQRSFEPQKGGVWTLQTDTGQLVAMMFNQSIGDQLSKAHQQHAPYLLTPSVVTAAKKLGFKVEDKTKEVEAAELLAGSTSVGISSRPISGARPPRLHALGPLLADQGSKFGRLTKRGMASDESKYI
jgi:S1-C subfamily serine protease